MKRNISDISNIISHLEYTINRLEELDDSYFIEQAYENVYRIYLILASSLNETMAASHILSYQNQPNLNEELVEEIDAAIMRIAKYLSSKVSQRSGIRRFNVLGILTSVYLIAFYEASVSEDENVKLVFNKIHSQLVETLASHTENGTTNANTDFCKHVRIIKDALKSKKYYKKAKELNVPDFDFSSLGEMMLFESEYPKDFLSGRWGVTRPLVQKNGYYFNDVDEFVLRK